MLAIDSCEGCEAVITMVKCVYVCKSVLARERTANITDCFGSLHCSISISD